MTIIGPIIPNQLTRRQGLIQLAARRLYYALGHDRAMKVAARLNEAINLPNRDWNHLCEQLIPKRTQ